MNVILVTMIVVGILEHFPRLGQKAKLKKKVKKRNWIPPLAVLKRRDRRASPRRLRLPPVPPVVANVAEGTVTAPGEAPTDDAMPFPIAVSPEEPTEPSLTVAPLKSALPEKV